MRKCVPQSYARFTPFKSINPNKISPKVLKPGKE